MLNFNNFVSTCPILDLKVSLNRTCHDLKLCLKKESIIFDKIGMNRLLCAYAVTPDLLQLNFNVDKIDSGKNRW